MKALRQLLLPFSLIYGLVIYIRNYLFDKGRLKSTKFALPIIGVGNLTVGGAGKTPHVEYLIRLLSKDYSVATLSRGYGRKTTGFLVADAFSNTTDIGDEPMQYKSKFKEVTVSVCEDRTTGIQNLMKREIHPSVILMDDAFQHRKVHPGLNILLIEYDSVFGTDYLLPAGNMREPWSSAKRADIIVITKSPSILVPIERKRILEKLNAASHQNIFFSFVKYGEFNRLIGSEDSMRMAASYYMEKRFTILLITGIANPSGMIEHLRRHTDKLEVLTFPDHHEFNAKDIGKIQQTFDNIANASKIIVTTEKDAMRLKNPDVANSIQKLPIFFLPIQIQIHQEEEKFNQLIIDYVGKNQQHSRIHTRKNF